LPKNPHTKPNKQLEVFTGKTPSQNQNVMEQPVEDRGTQTALRRCVVLQFGSPAYIWINDRKAFESKLLWEVC